VGGTLVYTQTEFATGSIGVPWKYVGLAGGQTQPMTEALVGRYRLSDEAVGVLAESWEWSNNNLTITFRLRKGVKFQDGADFNATAVKWNFDQNIAAKMTGTEVIGSTEIVDPYTFRVNLTTYQNTWLRKLTSEIAGANIGRMISPTAFQKLGADVDWNPVGIGTGPFQFKSFKRDQFLEYSRNDNYWGGKTLLDGMKIVIIADAVTAQMGFLAGEQDTFSAIGRDPQLQNDLLPKGYAMQAGLGLGFIFVPSGAKPNSPWANVKVRQAFEYAIDKESIVKNALYGYAYPLYKNATIQQLGYDPNFVGRRYDPAKAKALLAEAGYPNGFKTTLWCGTHLVGNDTLAVQAYMKAVGINADLNLITPAKWTEMETNGWDEGVMQSPQGAACFALFLERYYWTPTAPNWTKGLYYQTMYRPADNNARITALLAIADPAAEKQASIDLQQYYFDNAMAIQGWMHKGALFLQPYVHNYTPAKGYRADIIFDWTKCWLDK